MVHKPTTFAKHYTMSDIHNHNAPIEEHALPLNIDQLDGNQPGVNINFDQPDVDQLDLNINVVQPAVNMNAAFVIPEENNDDDDENNYDPEIKVSPFTQTYVNLLVKPYIDALSHANSKEGLLEWLPLVFEADYLEDTLDAVTNAEDLETARNEIVNIMIESLIDEAGQTAGEVITPWDIANARDPQLTKLFGGPSKLLPVNVTVGPNVYTHNLSQDFVYGILNVLVDNKHFNITLNGTQIPLEEIKLNYIAPKDDGVAYKAVLPQGAVFFNSPDVIQGVMTAAQWINTDAHTFVKELNGFINGKWIPLNF